MNWNIEINKLPGPDRKKLLYIDDREHVSPDGKHLALIYSIFEIRMDWAVGVLAIFREPSISPNALLIELELLVMAYCQNDIWLDSSTCVFTAYMWNGKDSVQLPFLILDIESKSLTFYPVMNSCMSTLTVADGGWVIKETKPDERFQCHHNELIRKEGLEWYAWRDFKKAKQDYWSGLFGKAT